MSDKESNDSILSRKQLAQLSTLSTADSLSSNYASESDFLQVCLLGKFYEPAYSHYVSGNVSNDNGSKIPTVTCNKCLRSNLESCYGYQNLDICVSCYQDIQLWRYGGSARSNKQQSPKRKSKTSRDYQFQSVSVTLMRTSNTTCTIG